MENLGLKALSKTAYKLPCCICGKEREFKSKSFFYKVRKYNKPCRSCSNSLQAGGKGNLYHKDSKTCTACSAIKALSEFFSYKKGYYHSCCKKCSKVKSQKYHKNVYRFAKYGLKKEDYHIMLINQNNKCAICKSELNNEVTIDHCHESGKVRGILCGKCNKGLGNFRDNVEFLTNAINYLKNE